ncbi:helix-turn-helix transcriptional regulator [Caldivirga sp. UBA161]|uniref:helix-turn-helix transcriptional regulator n=1 Tax=Caldivirga sp. UBA161 TaxID=1915569 RepID=UPI0025BAFBEB|nr:MarR family transcriptional regulator [Caldivirga sp. UBA161]
MMNKEHSALRSILIIIGVIILGVGAYLLYGALIMVNYMAYYHCMGMMCGMMAYYPLLLPIALLIIGAITVMAPIILINVNNPQGLNHAALQGATMEASSSSGYYDKVLRLLPKAEREVLEYVIKSGGEVFQYQIMREMGLSKVQSWRIVRRLEEKGLVEVVKVKGRNIVKLKDFNKG